MTKIQWLGMACSKTFRRQSEALVHYFKMDETFEGLFKYPLVSVVQLWRNAKTPEVDGARGRGRGNIPLE
jgi:hypothetical protein